MQYQNFNKFLSITPKINILTYELNNDHQEDVLLYEFNSLMVEITWRA